MATRDRTAQFTKFRTECKKKREEDKAAEAAAAGADNAVKIAVGVEQTLPPDWVDTLEGVSGDLAKIKEKRTLCDGVRACRAVVYVFFCCFHAFICGFVQWVS